MDSLTKLRRSINRISVIACLGSTALAAEPLYLAAIGGNYSIASRALPAGLSTVYSDLNADDRFTDFGGRFFRLHGRHGIGFSMGLVSSMNARALYTSTSTAVREFIQRQDTSAGGSHTLVSGKYGLGLGWVPLLARYRYAWVNDLVFFEAGLGPAYGFGALESSISVTNGTETKSEIRYHKYNEWGFMTNLTLGVNWQLAPGLSVQLLAEVAWLYARVRDPNLFVSDSVGWSQFFVRPGLALAFSF